jgi:nicotinamidase-related amidase
MVMAAIDHGFRVILRADALCSISDAAHDTLLDLYRNRFSVQIETATTEAVHHR